MRDKNIEYFKNERINATINDILWALDHLTPVEFRLWINHCKSYGSFHPSHFEAMEEHFIETGEWEFFENPGLKKDD